MSAQFPKRSTRPLTAESYRRSLREASAIIEEIASALAKVETHSVHEDSNDRDPCPVCKHQLTERAQLTRAIKDLAAHSVRLLERHNKEQS